jgi:putative hemolysin
MSYFSLVLGELVPKRIGMRSPEKVSFAVVGVLSAAAAAMRPFVKILSLSTNGLLRLLGIDPNADEESVTEEEIRMMVDVGGQKGVIEDAQKEMINNIFEFDDISVSEIMTHRTEMAAVEAGAPVQEVIALSVAEGYSRIPVYAEEPDNIIGVVYIKDLVQYIGAALPKGQTLRDLMREVYYVPETKRCGELFKELTEKKTQIAIVVDEYGGTAGLVTLEDILESIVGNIQDEFDDETEEISRIDERTFTLDGGTAIDELEDLAGVSLPEGDYDTVAGFVISLLGFLPKEGETHEVLYKNLRLTVLDVEDRRVVKLRAELLPAEEEAQRTF